MELTAFVVAFIVFKGSFQFLARVSEIREY